MSKQLPLSRFWNQSERSQPPQSPDSQFQSHKDSEHHRRLRRVKLLIDVPLDYEQTNDILLKSGKRKRQSISSQPNRKKSKKPKSKAIKCASGCRTEIADKDPAQKDAIQCCHQDENFDWVEQEENCSRWLCNGCRIKLGISTESAWFCSDHADMHSDNDIDEDEEVID